MFDYRNMKQGSAMNRFAALLAVCALTLAGCTTSAADPEEAEFLASVDLAGMDAVGIIDYLDALLVEPLRRI